MTALRFGALLGLSSCILACAQSPGAIAAKVHVDIGALAPCVRVAASSPGVPEVLSGPILRGERTDLVVAIYRGAGLSSSVSLVARGYVGKNGTGCDDPLTLNNESSPVSANFPATGVASIALEIPVLSTNFDADQDGYRGSAFGGSDCNDNDPTTYPGAPEVCNDFRDHNCNGLIACADPDCNDQRCAGDLCTNNGTCVNNTCNGAVAITCDTPPACHAGTGVCSIDAGCIYSPGVAGVACPDDNNACTDDQCDGDGGCIHPAKANSTPCGMPNACTLGACQSGTCTDSPVVCSPAPQCFTAQGCIEDAGCSYQPAQGDICPGGVCQSDGGCLVAFAYVPTNFVPSDVGTINAALVVSCLATLDSTNGQTTGACVPASLTSFPNDAGAMVVPIGGLVVQPGFGLQIIGPSPVILAVFGDAVVSGFIDVSANQATPGTGGAATGGLGAGMDGVVFNSAGGGGAGYGASGATGGEGQGNAGSGGVPGSSYGGASLGPLFGGSAGGNGSAPGSSGGGPPGAGGGAVQLSVTGTLTIDGGIWAAGGGGTAGSASSGATGGGGGGSGGAILLEAEVLSVTSTASITANGGAGGEGTSSSGPGGAAGENGHRQDAMQALGGAGPNGNGGNGGSTAGPAIDGGLGAGGPPPQNQQGGGGGGGATGWVRYNSPHTCTVSSGAVRSPLSSNASCQ